MRTLGDVETLLYTSGKTPPPIVRVRVKDASGAWQNLTTLANRDWVQELELNESVDSPVAEVRVSLKRDSFFDSLAPLRTDTRANLVTGSYAALLHPGAEIDIAVAITPAGITPVNDDWRTIFQGDIEDVDAGTDPLTITARDFGVRLQKLFFETETVYSPANNVSLEACAQAIIKDAHGPAWTAGTVKQLRDRVTPTTQNGYWYRATAVTGDQKTHATTQPTWPTTVGNTVVDNHVTWTCMGVCPTLYVPSATSFVMKAWTQKREHVFDALTALATNTIGWEIRYRYRASSGNYELTLYEPDRDNTTPDYTWNAGRYLDVQQHLVNRQDIRNAVQVVYSDLADPDVAGQPKRKTVRVEDADSQDTYTNGLPVFCEIAEAATSQINTGTQATNLANAALDDLKDPTVDQSVVLPFFYAVELGDLLGFTADGRLYTADQQLAVVSITHRHAAGEVPRTTVAVRGKPSLGAKRWVAIEARNGSARPATTVGPPAPTIGATSTVQGGGAVTIIPPLASVAGRVGPGHPMPHSYELHASASSGFTPDETTLVGRGSHLRHEIGDRRPGETTYVKVVPVDEKGTRGTASAEDSFVAGYTTPNAMQPIVAFGALPPNSSFEAWSLGSTEPPDRWTVNASSFNGGDWSQISGSYSGTYAVEIASGTTQRYLQSDLISVLPNLTCYAYAFFNVTGGTTSVYMAIEWFSDLVTSISVDSITPSLSAGAWLGAVIVAVAPSNAKYARLRVGRNTNAGARTVDIDHAFFASYEVPVIDAGGPSYANSWVDDSPTVLFQTMENGICYFTGAMKNGTVGSKAFTLPSKMRPGIQRVFAVDDNGSLARLEVKTNGDVTVLSTAGSASSVSLAGVWFPVGW